MTALPDLDAGWEIETPTQSVSEPELVEAASEALHLIAAEPGRSEGKRPLPGLPPEPNPRVVLAARTLKRARPGSEVAIKAATIMRSLAEPAPTTALPAHARGRRLPSPAGSHVVLASLHRFGAVCHISPPSRAPRRMPRATPAPTYAEVAEAPAPKRSFWQRLRGR